VVVVSRAVTLAAAMIALAGCDPEIVSDAYLCGPQMSCPSGMVCSAGTGRCVRPSLATPFECMQGAEGGEPNEDVANATEFAIAGCPATQVERLGCLPATSDVDWFAVTAATTCAGAALSIDVRYTVAYAPVIVDLMSPDGATVVQTAPPCDITGGEGANEAVCLDTVVPADGRTLIRVSLDPGLTCDGACDFAHYSLTASATAP